MHHIAFPNFADNSSSGELLRKFLKEKTTPLEGLHLLFSLNRWEAQKEIKEKLDGGINVIADRYSYSGVAYSVAKGN